MKKRYVLPVVGAVLALAVSVLAFLCSSTAGLHLLIRAAGRVLPGTLSVFSVQGRLADTLRLEGISYRDSEIEVAARDFSLSWRPASLLRLRLEIDAVDLNGASLQLREGQLRSPQAPTEAITFPSLAFPLAVKVGQVTVNSLSLLFPGDSTPMHIARVRLDNLAGRGNLLQVGSLEATAPGYRLKLAGEVQAGDTPGGRLTLDCFFSAEGYSPMAASAAIEGTPERLDVTMQIRQPFPGTLSGSVTGLAGELHWKAELQSDEVRLAEIAGEWPEFVLTGFKAAGNGTLADYSLLAEADADYGPFRDILVRTVIDGNAYGLNLSDTELARAGDSLQGHGTLSWRDDFSWQAELAGKRVSLANIDPAWPDGVLADLSLSGRGMLDTYSLEAAAVASYGTMRDMPVRAVLDGNAEGLSFRDTRLALPEGEITAEGQLGWPEEEIVWRATLNGTAVNPGAWQPQWPGRLNFRAASAGSLAGDSVRGGIELIALDGLLRDYPVQAGGSVTLDGERLEIDRLSLQVADSSLQVSGNYADNVDVGFTLRAPSLATLWPGAAGSLQAQGRLEGTRRHPVMQCSLSGEAVALNDLRIGTIAAEARGGLTAENSLHALLRMTDVAVADTLVGDVEASLKGGAAAHRLLADIGTGTDFMHLELAGGLSGSSWQGSLNRADLGHNRLGGWRLLEPAGLALSSGKITVGRLCLAGTEPARVCLAGDSGPEDRWQAEASLESLPLPYLQFGQFQAIDLDGTVSGSMALAGDRSGIRNGTLALTTGSVAMTFPSDNSRRSLTWRHNSLEASLADAHLTADLQSMFADGSTLASTVRFPGVFSFPRSLLQDQFEGSIVFTIKDLQPLAALTLPAVDPSGALAGKLFLGGTVARPNLSGSALLQGKIVVPPLGISVEGVEITLDGSSPAFRVAAAGTSGKGSLQAEGELLLPAWADPKLTVQVKGDRFAAAGLPELRVFVSPDLQGVLTRKQGGISGTILIPEAFIAPRNLAGAVVPSRDVVIVGPRAETPAADWKLSASLALLAGDNVQVDAFGLRGRVKGRLEVSALPGKPVTGNGTLTVENGTFAIYGRELAIKEGRLLYNGNLLDNPGVAVRAENTANGVTTGIQVAGFLHEPDISFYSTPPMAESAIISRLMLNTTLLGSSEQDKGFLGSFASRAGLDPLTSTVRGVRESLRLDEVKIASGGTTDDLSLVIGTWLTPELYISYGKNLLKESGSFNTRYLLGRGFSIQSESGETQSGADLKYEIDRWP